MKGERDVSQTKEMCTKMLSPSDILFSLVMFVFHKLLPIVIKRTQLFQTPFRLLTVSL